MARARQAPGQAKPTNDQLLKLAGFVQGTFNFVGTDDIHPVAVNKTEFYPQALSKMYGGEAKPFVTKNGKHMQGWFVPLNMRLSYLKQMEKEGLLTEIDPDQLLVYIDRLEKIVGAK
jgi:hypothetical protein